MIRFIFVFDGGWGNPGGGVTNMVMPAAEPPKTEWGSLLDWRVLALMLSYAMCFGMEITFDNVASLHFVDTFHLSRHAAGTPFEELRPDYSCSVCGGPLTGFGVFVPL